MYICEPVFLLLLSDVGSNNSGYYELQAVLTHKGRSSSSGHYVAWVRRKGGMCDKITWTLFGLARSHCAQKSLDSIVYLNTVF